MFISIQDVFILVAMYESVALYMSMCRCIWICALSHMHALFLVLKEKLVEEEEEW